MVCILEKSRIVIFSSLVLFFTLIWGEQLVWGHVFKKIAERQQSRADSAIIELRFGTWSVMARSDNVGQYSLQSPFIGEHFIRAWKWYGDQKWESGWHRVTFKLDSEKYVNLFLERSAYY